MSAKQRKKAAGQTNGGATSKGASTSPKSSADAHALQPLDPATAAGMSTAATSPSSGNSRPPTVSSFINKLYTIVSNPATQHIICWADHGQSFLVKDEYAFSLHIMKHHFRHSNFSSFVRQLNFYSFSKRSTPSAITQVRTTPRATPAHSRRTPHARTRMQLHGGRCTDTGVLLECSGSLWLQFDHPDFKRGREDLLHLIVRKSTTHATHGSDVAAVEGEGKFKAASGREKGSSGGGGEVYKDDIRQLGQQVRQLKGQYEELAKMQQRILFVFSRYVNAEQGGGRRKRYVSADADEDEGGGSGGGGGTAKKARLLIEDIETRTRRRNENAPTQNGAHGPASGGPRAVRRSNSLISPLADIDWSEQHAMQDLIHSPYMRGAPAVLNNTPLPMELPPLHSTMPASARDRRSRSPHPLLLTRGDEREEDEKKMSFLPRIDVPPRSSARKATAKFYDAGDSPSSQSSTSTEGDTDRRARALSFARQLPDPTSSAAMMAWNNSAHVAPNGIIYAPPATQPIVGSTSAVAMPLSPHLATAAGHSSHIVEHDGEDSGWLNGGSVKAESDDFSLSPAIYPYSMPNSPPLDALPLLSDSADTAPALDPSHLAVAAPSSFPPSPLPLSLPPSPLASPLPLATVGGLSVPLSTSAASTPTHFPLSPFLLTPSSRPFKHEPALR